MKFLLLSIALAITMPLFAQNKSKAVLPIEDAKMDNYLQLKKPARLMIKVINSTKPLEGTKVKFTMVHMGASTQVSDIIKLDAKGGASILLYENLPWQQVWVDVDDFLYTGVLVNEGLEITIDAAKQKKQVYLFDEDLLFSGKDAALNRAVCKRFLFRKDENDQLSSRLVDVSINATNKQMDQAAFVKIADSIYTALKKIDAEYLKKNPGYGWAIENETASSFYEWVVVGMRGDMNGAPALFKNAMAHKPFFTSNAGVGYYRNLSSYMANKSDNSTNNLQQHLNKLKGLNATQKTVLDSINYYEAKNDAQYKKTLKDLYSTRYQLLKTETNTFYFQNAKQAIEKNTEGPRADILKLSLMERWKDYFASIYPLIATSMKIGWTKNAVQTELNKATAQQNETNLLFAKADQLDGDGFNIGKPIVKLPFGANLYVLDSIGHIDDFIVNLKSKFKDKTLIVDIWATWCVPCISDMTNSKQLHEDSKSLPIEYVYLCTSSGSDIDTWKERIATLKTSGTHIFINEELEMAFRKKLNADGGYPTYIVINKAGSADSKKISSMSGLSLDDLKEILGMN